MGDSRAEREGRGVARAACALAGLASVLAIPGPASAADRAALITLWEIQPPTAPAGEGHVKDGETVLRQTLLPTGLAVLDADVANATGSRLVAKAGSQLIEATTNGGAIYCALATMRADKKTGALSENRGGTTLCLHDSESNGRFESVFEMPVGTGLAMIQGQVPKKVRPVDVGYRTRPVGEVQGDFWVGIRYEQYFNIYGNRMFFTDFGGRGQTQSLTDFAKFKAKGAFPQSVNVSGARFTVLAADQDGVRLRTDAPMPTGPFAVTTYTTTTFIPISY